MKIRKAVAQLRRLRKGPEMMAKRAMLMGLISNGMIMMEEGKMNVVIQEASKVLAETENEKVIIGINYHNLHGNKLVEAFRKIGVEPLYLSGKMPQGMSRRDFCFHRHAVIAKFNQHNNKHRLIIVSIPAGKAGIDLHDTSPGGQFRRRMWLIPSYDFMGLEQVFLSFLFSLFLFFSPQTLDFFETLLFLSHPLSLLLLLLLSLKFTGRVDRFGCTSGAIIRSVLSSTSRYEIGVLSSLAKKSKVQSTIVDEMVGVFKNHIGEWETVHKGETIYLDLEQKHKDKEEDDEDDEEDGGEEPSDEETAAALQKIMTGDENF